METNRLLQIGNHGQSIWLDFIDRDILTSGKLAAYIEQDGIKGVTSNPAIFEKAINGSADYDADIVELLQYSHDSEKVFYQLAVKDIQAAADLFKGVYCQKGRRAYDGYVSLEVSPFHAHRTQDTINQAIELWKDVDRENVMIKIPATEAGIPAIKACISEGININITLLFGLERYGQVIEAYISGLENRQHNGKSIKNIASVASFFLSRIDVLIDPQLKQKGKTDLLGTVAVSSAKIAYQMYKEAFSSNRWRVLAENGAMPQRLLWASTGSKNPEFKDTKYIEELIGPETVSTIPLETLDAFRKHGEASNTLEQDIASSKQILMAVEQNGIDLNLVAEQLESEGIAKFNVPFEMILRSIDKKKGTIITQSNNKKS